MIISLSIVNLNLGKTHQQQKNTKFLMDNHNTKIKKLLKKRRRVKKKQRNQNKRRKYLLTIQK